MSITIHQIDEYFSARIGGAKWSAYSEEQRIAAAVSATDDVGNELTGLEIDDSNPLHLGAVAEQALHLLESTETTLTAATVLAAESIDGIGSRSYREPSGNVLLSERCKIFIERIRRESGGRRILRG